MTNQQSVNWAILAPGKIAEKFATALKGVKNTHLYSVASRNFDRAQAFADTHGFETVASSYAELMADPKVDVVYIASPHAFHAEQSIACLNAKKAVLCEKPMTLNVKQAQQVFDAAQQNNVFYMEAVWARFMPLLKKVREIIDEGEIGDVKMAQASFGINVPFNQSHRLYNKQLGGGALLDLGIYTISFSQWLMQTMPSSISAESTIGNSGVDEQTGIVLHYPEGQVITLNTAINALSSHEGWIFGSKGRIKLPSFWKCEKAIIENNDGKQRVIEMPHKINGYEGEIEEVNRCLKQGKIESDILSWRESLSVMQIMDQIRSQIGLTYQ